jgi:hypothetical protein
MSKSINTLVDDINAVILGNGGWTTTINNNFEKAMGEAAARRFSSSKDTREKTLRMSNIGTPCRRKLWYYLNLTEAEKELPAYVHLKFAYGDFLEVLLLSLAKAAGHTVEGEQDELVLNGIVGHRDAVIDGVTVDVKSASTLGFRKFEKNNLREDDPFGYIKQLTAYVKAAEHDPLVKDKKGGAFLVVDKQHGHITLDYYDLSKELKTISDDIELTKELLKIPVVPLRHFEEVPEGKSGNMKLPAGCSYCDHKFTCWTGLRGFAYANGPVFLTKVVKLPMVPEFKE